MQALSALHAPELKPAPAAAQKRGAIIGSAPQLNAQGLLAAAELAKEREAAKLKKVLLARMWSGSGLASCVWEGLPCPAVGCAVWQLRVQMLCLTFRCLA